MSFQEQVLALVEQIPRGRVTTYGSIAQRLERSPRAVGQALKRNTRPIAIPCHRVVCSDGSLGGYSGPQNKAKLLKSEGVKIANGRVSREHILDVHTRD